MRPSVTLATLAIALIGCLPGCAPVSRRGEAVVRWSGDVTIAGTHVVPRGTTLVVEGGTRALFAPDPAGAPGGLLVQGNISAEGSEENPILFDAAPPSRGPESWEGIRIESAAGFLLRWVRVTNARYGIHAHFSSGEVRHCRLDGNLEGARIGKSRITFRECLIDGNLSKGISMTDSENAIVGCTVTGNRYGLFLFEGTRGDRIEGNNLAGNTLFDLRLGDFFSGAISLGANWWGPLGEGARIDPPDAFDATGGVPRSDRPVPEAGFWLPGRTWPFRWEIPTEGFVDAPAAVAGGTAFVGSWDGVFRAIDLGTGRILWNAPTGAPIDATPVLAGDAVIVPAWDRTVRAFSRADGKVLWTFTWPASGYDDHRQASPRLWGSALLVGGWNGVLYALDPSSGSVRWEREIGGAIRSAPAVTADGVAVATDGGRVALLDASGKPLWETVFDEGFRAAPLPLDGTILLAGRKGTVVSLDARTGAVRWRRRLANGVEYASPILHRGAIVVADTGGNLSLLDPATGGMRMVIPVGAPLYASPLSADGALIAADTGGKILEIDSATGIARRRVQLQGAIHATPVPVDGGLLVTSRAGTIVLLGAP